MLLSKGLNKNLWAEAINTASFTLNRTRKKRIDDKTPFELQSGRKINLNFFKIFGTEVYAYIPKCKRNKLGSKSKLCTFVGYDSCTKDYRILADKSSRIEVHREVLCKNENESNKIIINKESDYELCI